MTPDADGQQVWQVSAPSDGVQPPWPQMMEIVQAIPRTQWTLVGGLMVQLHAAYAGVQVTRTTRDVDMILHIETGAATFSGVQHELARHAWGMRVRSEHRSEHTDARRRRRELAETQT
jgi:hypothetical protein